MNTISQLKWQLQRSAYLQNEMLKTKLRGFLGKVINMSRRCSEDETIFRFSKMFIIQYLTNLHGFEKFQEGAVNLLAIYLTKLIRGLALQVKKLLDMQGRTLANPLHLLATSHRLQCFNFEEFLQFLVSKKDPCSKQIQFLHKLGQKIFKHDLQEVNCYTPCQQYPNISYIPSVYTVNIEEKALPYRHPAWQTFPLPQEMGFRATKTVVSRQAKGLQTLEAYHRREIKRGLTGLEMREAQQLKISSMVKMDPQKRETSVYITKDMSRSSKNRLKDIGGQPIDRAQSDSGQGEIYHKNEEKRTSTKIPSRLTARSKSKSLHSETEVQGQNWRVRRLPESEGGQWRSSDGEGLSPLRKRLKFSLIQHL